MNRQEQERTGEIQHELKLASEQMEDAAIFLKNAYDKIEAYDLWRIFGADIQDARALLNRTIESTNGVITGIEREK